MKFEIRKLLLAVPVMVMLMLLTGCGRPSNEVPGLPEEESKTAVFTARITLSGDKALFLCNGSFFALPADASALYDADGREMILKNGIYYADDMDSLCIRTSGNAEYLCGRIACVIKDAYSGTLAVKFDLLKNEKTLLSKQYSIASSDIGASIFFESDKEDVSFELMGNKITD